MTAVITFVKHYVLTPLATISCTEKTVSASLPYRLQYAKQDSRGKKTLFIIANVNVKLKVEPMMTSR